MNHDDDITASEVAEAEQCFTTICGPSRTEEKYGLQSPSPRAPPDALQTRSGEHAQGIQYTHLTINLPLTSSYSVLRALWTLTHLRVIVLIIVLVAIVSTSVWQRLIFETAHLPDFNGHPTDPPLVIAAITLGKAVFIALLLLVCHCLGGLGNLVERCAFEWRTLVGMSLLSFMSTCLAAFASSAMTWPTAVILNPLASAPLFFLLSARCVGGLKRLPWSATAIVSVAVVAMCCGLIRGVADHSFVSPSGALGEAAACGVALVSGALLGLSLALTEKYFVCFPVSPLYAISVCSFIEVLLLPLVLLFDAIPSFGSSSGVGIAASRFFSLHRSDIPPTLVWLVFAHTAFGCVVTPMLTRCPALLVPIFSLGPLIAASVFPGPALPVVIGGVYCFLVITLLLAAEAEYSEDEIIANQRKCRVTRVADDDVLWRHGCSILHWKRLSDRYDPVRDEHSTVGYKVIEALVVLGWLPLSSVFSSYVKYSAAVCSVAKKKAWGNGVDRIRGVIDQ